MKHPCLDTVRPGSPLAFARRVARALALPLLAVAAAATTAAAQFDSFPVKIEVNQAIQAGSTQLVGGRTTWVRCVVRLVSQPVTPLPIDGLLHITVDGVEIPGSPIFSDNGPYPDAPGPNFQLENSTLNFIFIAPTSNNVVLTVDGNPLGPNYQPEDNMANNSLSTATLNFQARGLAELAYAPIDYHPSGGTLPPNVPDPAMIAPGMGDNFINGIYPIGDWYYHRIDAPSKLFQQSLAGSGSPLLNSLQVDINLMVPKPDFLYGYVPGPLPGYNGQSVIGGNVSMGNTELSRYQRTIAHELGHNFGLQHNNTVVGLVGIDVEWGLHLPLLLGQIKPSNLFDIMVGGLFTQEAWVATSSYNVFLNHPVFAPSAATADDGAQGVAPGLFVAGTWNRTTGALELTDVLELPQGRLTAPAAPGTGELTLRAFAGGAPVTALSVAARTSADDVGGCLDADSGTAIPITCFSAVLPASAGGAPVDRLVIGPAGSQNAGTIELVRSASAPQVAFSGAVNEPLLGGTLHVAWSGADAEGDALTYYLTYSPDGTRSVPILTSTKLTGLDVDIAGLPAFVAGQGFFELRASDGLNTTSVRTPPLTRSAQWKGVVGNLPWVEMLSPDDGFSYLRGAQAILHSSGWDLEDRALEGDSIVWTSDVDGQIGTGRLLAVSSLSVGSHLITVTATDSDGMTASDTATITIVDRGLPTVGVVCQADLGFGGPGSSVLSVCGGDLSTGTTADLLLTGAPASSPALLVMGLVNGPAPFKGGTLVPVPWTLITPVSTDIDGEISIPGVAGGGGPLSVYLQFAIADGSQAQGVGLSNAVRIDLLP